jgi:hypothetical protein
MKQHKYKITGQRKPFLFTMIIFVLYSFNFTKAEEKNMMEKFQFLLGLWKLKYDIPKSQFSEAMTGSGTGEFKKALDDKYVFFDYSTSINGETGSAHGVFVWDEKVKTYRYWWFENSGNFAIATCKFLNDRTLFMIWHDTFLIQTFQKIDTDKVILKMGNPDSKGKFRLIMEVTFTRK